MLKKISKAMVNLMQKYLPDAFIFCVVLTIVVFFLAMPLTGQGPASMVMHWGNGVWNLLAFSMQMALVLVLGSSFANAPAIKKILASLAKLPKSPSSAVALVTVVGFVASWLQWGFGLIVGTLVAREIAKIRKDTDYRLLVAAGYIGFVCWHAGFSGSIPLDLAAFAASVTKNTGGIVTEAISTSKTIFAPWNLVACAACLVALPLVVSQMHPDPADTFIVDPSVLVDEERTYPKATTPAQALENSPILSYFVVVIGVVYIARLIMTGKFVLSLNTVNLIFLLLGIAFHVTPIRYVHAVADATKGAYGVILQFPFYAGIQGMMVGVSAATGLTLAGVISNGFVAISNNVTFPIFTFLAAGIVNFFVPSGGGQWSVQGPIILPAAVQLGVPPHLAAMSIAWGDAWTNLLQPFWALPALGVAKLGAKDIMGYCVVGLIVSGIIVVICLAMAGMGILMPA